MEIIIPVIEVLLIGIPVLLLALRLLVRTPDRRFMTRIVLIAFGLRLGASVMFAAVPETRLFHEDAYAYEIGGCEVASAWLGEAPAYMATESASWTSGHYPGFLYFCSILYFIFGRYRLVATAFIGLFSCVSIILLYRLCATVFHAQVARRAAMLAAFFPSMILWSSMAIKDPIVIFLLLAGLNAALSLRRDLKISAIVLLLGVTSAMWAVRFYIVYFFAFAVVTSLLVVRGKRVSGLGTRMIALGMLVGLLAMVGMTKTLAGSADKLSLEAAATYRVGMAVSANSGFSHDADVSTMGGALAFLPIGVSTLLFGPFPWQMTSFRALFTLPEMLLWWSMIPSLLRGLRYAIRREFVATAPFLVFTTTLCVAYGLSLGNLGAAFRQRAQVFVFLFIFAALGHYVAVCRQRRLNPDILRASPTG